MSPKTERKIMSLELYTGEKISWVSAHPWGGVGVSASYIGDGEIELTLWDPDQGGVNLALFAGEAKGLRDALNRWLPA